MTKKPVEQFTDAEIDIYNQALETFAEAQDGDAEFNSFAGSIAAAHAARMARGAQLVRVDGKVMTRGWLHSPRRRSFDPQ